VSTDGDGRDSDLVRASLLVSVVSVAWTLSSSAAAVTLGVIEQSAVLVALGAIGVVDAWGSTALVFHFRHVLRHDRISPLREAFAHRLVSVGLVTVGVASVVAGSVRLATGEQADSGAAGALVAVASLAALGVLSRRKRVLGVRVRDRALIGDAHLSAIGAVQAAVALIGIVLTRTLDAGWVDAATTVALGLVASCVGISTWRTERHVA
jgi:divalent metal cation (Fe/Co/Zn/Cd) transporter